mmetsp:Transcript_42222/g.117576  ORF Transcript_42222/g.117576 Transcript_42222/m.117576 type:complete len:431 (-) Transcript_42222:245-1537(-)
MRSCSSSLRLRRSSATRMCSKRPDSRSHMASSRSWVLVRNALLALRRLQRPRSSIPDVTLSPASICNARISRTVVSSCACDRFANASKSSTAFTSLLKTFSASCSELANLPQSCLGQEPAAELCESSSAMSLRWTSSMLASSAASRFCMASSTARAALVPSSFSLAAAPALRKLEKGPSLRGSSALLPFMRSSSARISFLVVSSCVCATSSSSVSASHVAEAGAPSALCRTSAASIGSGTTDLGTASGTTGALAARLVRTASKRCWRDASTVSVSTRPSRGPTRPACAVPSRSSNATSRSRNASSPASSLRRRLTSRGGGAAPQVKRCHTLLTRAIHLRSPRVSTSFSCSGRNPSFCNRSSSRISFAVWSRRGPKRRCTAAVGPGPRPRLAASAMAAAARPRPVARRPARSSSAEIPSLPPAEVRWRGGP